MAPRLVQTRRAFLLGILIAAIFGVAMRMMAINDFTSSLFRVMTVGFIFVVPLVIGYLAVIPHPKPSILYQVFVPWIPTAISVGIVSAFGAEGAICIIMTGPVLLLMSSIGGVVAGVVRERRIERVAALAALPFLVSGIESRIPSAVQMREVTSAIDIAAPAPRVWREIVSVPAIPRDELPDALYLRMGFPAPISATIDGAGVGAVRRARFEGGVLFLETVTDWKENELLSFRIVAQTDSIPRTTLDSHVTIGGPYFDVLQGTYRLEPLAPGRTRLHLTSRLRLSTHFNAYAGPWADAIMKSIQETILAVEESRSLSEGGS